jgi:hypothetical protein
MATLRAAAAISLVVAATLVTACSDDGDASAVNPADAAVVVAQVFEQERAGGLLAEGEALIVPRGVESNSVVELPVSSEHEANGIDARYCMEYSFIAGTESRSRVYVAERAEGAWDVESVNPNGTCEGVT